MSYTGKRTSLLFIIYFGVQVIQDLPLGLCRLLLSPLPSTLTCGLPPKKQQPLL